MPDRTTCPARAIAEGTAARLLTAERSAVTLGVLRNVLVRQQEARAQSDHRALALIHWEFHRTICHRSNNPFLLDLWTKVSNVIRIYSTGAFYKTAVENNEVFLRYFSEKSPSEAEEVLRSQIIVMSYFYLNKPIPAGDPGVRGCEHRNKPHHYSITSSAATN